MKWLIALLLAASQPVWANADYSLWDSSNQQVVVEHAQGPKPIASLTKIMTAMVYVDAYPSLDQSMLLVNQVKGHLPKKYYTAEELLKALLVWSDNAAAETLAANYPGGRTAFIQAMNNKAKDLALKDTYFDDPSGLSKLNVSTVNDVTAMMLASNGYSVIKNISTLRQAQVLINGQRKHTVVQRPNTNFQTLSTINDIIVSKTGYTTPAGFCMGLVIEQGKKVYVLVVLGAKNKVDRLQLVKNLVAKNITLNG